MNRIRGGDATKQGRVPLFALVRAGASTMELSGSQTHEYMKQRFV